MSFQFVHMQTFGRKPDKSGVGSGFVFDEAARKPEASLHVENPAEPVIIFGEGVEGLRARHDAQADAARVVDRTGKEKRAKVTQHTLMTVVASHPYTPDQVQEDPAKAVEVERWQGLVKDWLQAEFGDRLVTVLRHDDEAHVHLHAYALPDGRDMRAREMHPGAVAKDAEVAAAKAGGADAKEANKRGDKAYRAAMRGWQDRYWEAVGLPCGQTRLGPGRRRLSKSGHEAEKAQVEHAAAALATVDQAQGKAKDLSERGGAFVARAREAAVKAKAEADAAEARRIEAEQVERQVRQEAAKLVKKARQEAASIVRDAERRADRLRRVGVFLGVAWVGLTGVRLRLDAVADRRVAEIQAQAKEGVAGALTAARAEVGSELSTARRDAADARVRVEAAERRVREAEAARIAAERREGTERAGRLRAEREREDFRGRWAVADNRLQAMGRGYGR